MAEILGAIIKSTSRLVLVGAATVALADSCGAEGRNNGDVKTPHNGSATAGYDLNRLGCGYLSLILGPNETKTLQLEGTDRSLTLWFDGKRLQISRGSSGDYQTSLGKDEETDTPLDFLPDSTVDVTHDGTGGVGLTRDCKNS